VETVAAAKQKYTPKTEIQLVVKQKDGEAKSQRSDKTRNLCNRKVTA